jgi:excisionase family DNA binding protein
VGFSVPRREVCGTVRKLSKVAGSEPNHAGELPVVELKPIQEAAEELGVSRDTLDRLIKAGKLARYERHGDRRVYVDMEQARQVLSFRRTDSGGSSSEP